MAEPENPELLNELIHRFRFLLIAGGFDQQQIGELLITSGGAMLCVAEGRLGAVKSLRSLADQLEAGFAKIN